MYVLVAKTPTQGHAARQELVLSKLKMLLKFSPPLETKRKKSNDRSGFQSYGNKCRHDFRLTQRPLCQINTRNRVEICS